MIGSAHKSFAFFFVHNGVCTVRVIRQILLNYEHCSEDSFKLNEPIIALVSWFTVMHRVAI